MLPRCTFPGQHAYTVESPMSASTITVQFSNGPRAVEASKLRELVDSGRVTGSMRVASMDGGATWITVDQALASGATGQASVAATTIPVESIPDAVLGDAWGAVADAGDPPFSDGWERTPTRVVAGFLDLARSKLTSSYFLCGSSTAVRIGNIAVIVAAVIGVVVAAINAGKGEKFRIFLDGSILSVILLICQYAANRAIGAGERIVAATRCSVRSRAALDLIALFALVAGLAAFASGIAQTVDTESYPGIINGTAAMLVSWFAAALAFAPGLTTTRVDHTVSAWKEAVGVLGFIGKSALRMAPVIFGIATVVVTIHLAWSARYIVKENAPVGDILASVLAQQGTLIGLAVLPAIAYLAFTAWYAVLALIESVFHLERQAAPKA